MSVWNQPPVVKHKVFVSYHHRGDQLYYDAFSSAFHDTYQTIYDNSLERRVDSTDADYVMRNIRENYLTGTSCTLVFVGKDTWGRKFVDWEIKSTLDKQHALIGVALPGAPRAANGNTIVPDRLHDNIQSGYASWVSWAQITASSAQLSSYITSAKSKSKALISNARERRLRNA